MTTTIVSTALTAVQSINGLDTLVVTQTGSVVTSGNSINISGDDNLVMIDGLVVGAGNTVNLNSGGVDNALSVAATGRIIGTNATAFNVYMGASESTVTNHGAISGYYGIGIDGTNNSVRNFGTIEALGETYSNEAGITLRASFGEISNQGLILGASYGVRVEGATSASEITNSGRIEGDVGIFFGAASNMKVVNTGHIIGTGETAISTLALNTNILNTGVIEGDVFFDAAGGFIKNSGQILGDVFLDESGSYYKGAVDGWVSGGVRGASGDDSIYGASGFDYIEGGGGSDKVKGRAGDDQIFAQGGMDTVHGNDGDDLIDGGGSRDFLSGGRGEDTILGSSGADTINGGSGNDTLSGGSGNDVFVFKRDSDNDLVTDFEDGVDQLDLSALSAASFAALTGAGAITSDGGSGSLINLGLIGGDGVIAVETMAVGDWNAGEFIF